MKTLTALRVAALFLIACTTPTPNEVAMKPLTVINRLVIKPGKLDELIAAQRTYVATMMIGPDGLISSRMYRGVDGTTAILVSQFASKAAQEEVSKQPAFLNHLRTLQPLVESSSPIACEEAYAWGKPQ